MPPLTLCAYMKKGPNLRWGLIQCSGGDEGDRTPDLLTASQALSQLSYAPVRRSTIRELPRRCKDNFGKYFKGRRRGNAARPRTQARERAARPRDAPRCPAMPFSPAGARPEGGGVAAALLSGALGTSRIPRTAVSRIRGAVRHPPNGCPAGAGPIIGANRAPAHPTISKPCRFTGPGREPPSMAQSVKSKPQVDDSHIPRNAGYGRPLLVQPRNPT